MIGVISDGTFITQSHRVSISQGFMPVNPITFSPRALAHSIDFIIFFELPDVEIAI